MNYFEAIVLGIVQGLTEFLPVSSSGHLEIMKSLFGIDPAASFYFTIAVHGATVLSTLVVFRKEIYCLAEGFLKFRMNDETIYIVKLVISMIPVGIVGVFFMKQVEEMFSGNMVSIGIQQIITGLILVIGYLAKDRGRTIGYLDAFIIGIAQAIAVIPAISRSGATISTGMLLGNKKDELAKFSFLMVIVPVIGANIFEFLSPEKIMTGTSVLVILAGFVAAFISGYLACKWMINLVKKSKLVWFSVYCVIVGLLVILFA